MVMFPNRQILDPNKFNPLMEGDDEGRRLLFGTALQNLGYTGNQYNQFMKLYEPQFGKFLAYQGDQQQTGFQNPSFVNFINQTFDPNREQVRNPDIFQRRTPAPLRYFYR